MLEFPQIFKILAHQVDMISTFFLKKIQCFQKIFDSDIGFSFPISSMIVFSLKDTRLPHATLAGQQAAGIYFSFTILHTYFVVYLLYNIQLQYFCYIVTLPYTLRIKATLQIFVSSESSLVWVTFHLLFLLQNCDSAVELSFHDVSS